MILRRISSAIRRQDWFTVLIEIGIVVIGLLIGLQINNWNEARADRAKEDAFLERMAVDVDRAREQLAGFLVERDARLRSISRVENMYFGDGEIVELSESECSRFAGMDTITHPPVAVPSITEAFAGGRIDLLSDAKLIQALIIVEQSEDRLRTVIDSLKNQAPVLPKKYPDAISYARATEVSDDDFDNTVFAISGYEMAAQCHFLETTPKREFMSDVVLGLQINQWYVNFLNRHLERLDELATVLDGAPVSNLDEREASE